MNTADPMDQQNDLGSVRIDVGLVETDQQIRPRAVRS
jgi:hypothetical protein